MSDKINLSYDASSNLMLAYGIMRELSAAAKAHGFGKLQYHTTLQAQEDGYLFFSLDYTNGPDSFLCGIDTEEASIFKQRADAFREAWMNAMNDAGSERQRKIAELKEELAKLEGK